MRGEKRKEKKRKGVKVDGSIERPMESLIGCPCLIPHQQAISLAKNGAGPELLVGLVLE